MYGLCPVMLAIVAACGSPVLPSGEIACGPGGSCPDGMTCARELCWTDPPGEWDAGSPDASAVDANLPAAEHTREAEAYDDLVLLPGTAGSAVWTERDEIPGAVGEYLMALPNDGVNCLEEPPSNCGAVVVYDLPEMLPGAYYLHLRSSAASANDDSLFFGIDDRLIGTANLPDAAAWAWRRHTLGDLDQEPHQLHIWVREDGAAMDRFVVSQSTASPE